MEFLLDTIDLDCIEKYTKALPVAGVTSNPSIVKKQGKIDFFNHMKQIRQIIGPSATLHIQLVGQTISEMLADAQTIFEQVGPETYVKVPTTLIGLEVIKRLKQEGHNVTATAIYTKLQGLLAISAGADYIAPYYNRMQNMGINAPEVIKEFAAAIISNGTQTKILAASFHNVDQITTALANGAQAVTVDPALIATGLNHPAIQQAVNDFTNDWEATFGVGQTITSLLS
ncbi:fructose-6-phosphate aldolase [Liquorilactobacillus sp.]|uniref:fructose-6-phosphate aldolase n=1 Tax=Liquorilactobacillus sp. TaxID=2767923 RepID=UPI0039EBF95F